VLVGRLTYTFISKEKNTTERVTPDPSILLYGSQEITNEENRREQKKRKEREVVGNRYRHYLTVCSLAVEFTFLSFEFE
jgi:hypothetical protein